MYLKNEVIPASRNDIRSTTNTRRALSTVLVYLPENMPAVGSGARCKLSHWVDHAASRDVDGSRGRAISTRRDLGTRTRTVCSHRRAGVSLRSADGIAHLLPPTRVVPVLSVCVWSQAAQAARCMGPAGAGPVERYLGIPAWTRRSLDPEGLTLHVRSVRVESAGCLSETEGDMVSSARTPHSLRKGPLD